MSIELKNIDFQSYQKKFGIKVRTLRKKKGLSQLDLATRINLDKSSISRIENGRTNITLKTAVIISFALDYPLENLFDFNKAKSKSL